MKVWCILVSKRNRGIWCSTSSVESIDMDFGFYNEDNSTKKFSDKEQYNKAKVYTYA